MSRHSTSGSKESDREKCGVELADGTKCGNPASEPDGTCHIDGHARDTSPEGGSDGSRDVREAFATVAAAFEDEIETYVEKSEAVNPDDPAERAALALARKVGRRNAWVVAFGECSHDGCDRGATGFTADTCDEHEPSDESDESGSDGVSVSDVAEALGVSEAVAKEMME